MSHRSKMVYVGGAIALAVAVVLAAGLVACTAISWAQESTAPPAPGSSAETPKTETPERETPSKSDAPARDKAIADFERRLGRFKPLGKDKRKGPDDYYLTGTAVINPQTQHADVRFQVVQGQRKTAEFLVDFIAGQAEGTLHKWHVFARFKENAEAEQGLASARQQYDQMLAYRQEMQRIYQVLSTTRC